MKKENPLINLIVNIIIPVFILTKFSSEETLGPVYGLIVALAFPIVYGVYDIIKDKKVNPLSVIGVASVFLTGILGVFAFPASWIAIKEASVPLIIAILIVATAKTKFSVVKTLLHQVIAVDRLYAVLKEKKKETQYENKMVLFSYLVAVTFLVSSVLNYVLAKVLLTGVPGTEEFNQELAKMTALSFPVIAIPSMILFMGVLIYYISYIQKQTGLQFEEILVEQIETDKKKKEVTVDTHGKKASKTKTKRR